jgi:hypothetical protein
MKSPAFLFGVVQDLPGSFYHNRADLLFARIAAIEDNVGHALLCLFVIELISDNAIEHRVIHQNLETCVPSVLIDQRTGVEWLHGLRQKVGRFADLRENAHAGGEKPLASCW